MDVFLETLVADSGGDNEHVDTRNMPIRQWISYYLDDPDRCDPSDLMTMLLCITDSDFIDDHALEDAFNERRRYDEQRFYTDEERFTEEEQP